jgi:hypothetical protein
MKTAFVYLKNLYRPRAAEGSVDAILSLKWRISLE